MSDGWRIKKSKIIINFLVYCTKGMIFMKSVDATEKYKNINYISSLMSEVIDEVGASRHSCCTNGF
jgi:Protein of unknown function (DUF 659)